MKILKNNWYYVNVEEGQVIVKISGEKAGRPYGNVKQKTDSVKSFFIGEVISLGPRAKVEHLGMFRCLEHLLTELPEYAIWMY